MFSKILGVEIKPDPILIIIGVSEWLGKLQVAQKRLISYGLVTAKKQILLFWKKKEAPTVKLWITDLTETIN